MGEPPSLVVTIFDVIDRPPLRKLKERSELLEFGGKSSAEVQKIKYAREDRKASLKRVLNEPKLPTPPISHHYTAAHDLAQYILAESSRLPVVGKDRWVRRDE